MIRRHLSQEQTIELISEIASEYKRSTHHNESNLKITLDELDRLIVKSPGPQTMEIIHILKAGLKQALLFDDIAKSIRSNKQSAI